MAKIAFCLPPLKGHVEAHRALAEALMARGHDAVFVGTNGLGDYATQAELPFASLGMNEGNLARAGLLKTLRITAQTTRAWVRHGPEILAKAAPDLVICDQVEPGACLAAEAAKLTYLTLAAALPADRDEAIPPPYVPWPFLEGEEGKKRNRGGWRVADYLLNFQSRELAKGCQTYGLEMRTKLDEWISPLCDLRQLPHSMDFPHEPPASACPTGPLRARPFPKRSKQKSGKKVVFASLGSLQGSRKALMHAIAAAADALDVELYLAHGGGLSAREVAALPGQPHARDYHDQLEVLSNADACVTHCGMNTVLDCVAMRVPMVAIPLAFEQPAIAARLDYHALAHIVPKRKADRASIKAALEDVLSPSRFEAALDREARAIHALGGVKFAAQKVESFL